MKYRCKRIEGFKDYYITTTGKVYSFRCKTRLKPLKHSLRRGYPSVIFCSGVINNTSYHHKTIHRLVAEAFIEPVENKPMVNHIDGVKTNNDINNLEWCSASENLRHAHSIGLINQSGENNNGSKLNKDNVISIKKLLINRTLFYRQIGDMFNVSEATIRDINNGKSWKHVSI